MSSIDRLSEVTELVSYVLYSDYVKLDLEHKEVALSAMIIAKVESGKTAVINQFVPNDGILVLSDVTEYGLLHDYLDDLKDGTIHRLLIPDLINPVNRKQDTVNTLITFFNSYISWEGVNSISTYAMPNIRLVNPLRGSLLTTIAIGDFNRMMGRMAAVGFISRLMPITYSYTQEAVRAILLDIAHGRDKWDSVKLDFPKDKVDVRLEGLLAERLMGLSEVIGGQAGGYGFRSMHQFMTLAKSRALAKGRDNVSVEDVECVEYLATRFVKFPEGTDANALSEYNESDGG